MEQYIRPFGSGPARSTLETMKARNVALALVYAWTCSYMAWRSSLTRAAFFAHDVAGAVNWLCLDALESEDPLGSIGHLEGVLSAYVRDVRWGHTRHEEAAWKMRRELSRTGYLTSRTMRYLSSSALFELVMHPVVAAVVFLHSDRDDIGKYALLEMERAASFVRNELDYLNWVRAGGGTQV
jgi:hypothetical protein